MAQTGVRLPGRVIRRPTCRPQLGVTDRMSDTDSQNPTKAELLAAIAQLQETEDGTVGDLVVVTDAVVKSDGRLTIPAETRERYGIEEGDYVDALLMPDRD